MVEQDLLISVMLVALFRDDTICSSLLFRGGTALHKLYLDHPLRYSEDIDLVQHEAGPIGPQFDRIRATLRDQFGEPQRKIGPNVATLTYRLESEDSPPLPLRIKMEINTREHMQILPAAHRQLDVQSRWFEGQVNVPIYHLDELLATKLRALYQRRKGRDLFDLALALRSLPVDIARLCKVFHHYMKAEGHRITAANFRANLAAKLDHPGFLEDCKPLIRPGATFDLHEDFELIDHALCRDDGHSVYKAFAADAGVAHKAVNLSAGIHGVADVPLRRGKDMRRKTRLGSHFLRPEASLFLVVTLTLPLALPRYP